MAESVWALHCDPHLVGQLAVAAHCCMVVQFSLGCVHTSPTPAVDFTSSAQLSALHASRVPSLGKAQASGMVNRRIKIKNIQGGIYIYHHLVFIINWKICTPAMVCGGWLAYALRGVWFVGFALRH